MQNNLGSSEGQILLLAIIGKLTIFNHYPFVYSTPLKSSLHLASNGRWSTSPFLEGKSPAVRHQKRIREWGVRKGWQWSLQLFMFVNQRQLSNLANIAENENTVKMKIPMHFGKHSCKRCWHSFRTVYKLFALSTVAACRCKDLVMRGGRLACCHVMLGQLPRGDIQAQGRMLSWLSEDKPSFIVLFAYSWVYILGPVS